MATDDHARRRIARGRASLRNTVATLVIVLLLGGIFLFVAPYEERPNFYEPARSAITQAAQQLSESYGDEKELVEKLQLARRHLDSAVDLLDKAEQFDPADKREIATLRVRLRALEDPERIASTSPEALQRSYNDLIGQLNALAHKLEKPSP